MRKQRNEDQFKLSISYNKIHDRLERKEERRKQKEERRKKKENLLSSIFFCQTKEEKWGENWCGTVKYLTIMRKTRFPSH